MDTNLEYAPESRGVVSASWSWPLRLGLLLSLVASTGVIAAMAHVVVQRKAAEQEQDALLAFRGLHPEVTQSLDAAYTDGDGDLIADTPVGASALISPQPVVLAHYLGDDEGESRVDWEAMKQRLTEATGREVEIRAYLHTPEEREAIARGEIQLVAAHSAEVPRLVNTAGLVPFAELGAEGTVDGNRLVIAVGPDSKTESLEELRGKTLVCTEPDSLTGYRAAIVAIYLETGMLPSVDYEIYFSHKHERSIRGVAIGKFPFIALSNDVLDRMLQRGRVDSSEYRVLFESQPIPRLTIGHVHSLAPDLADRVKRAVLNFDNRPASPYRFRPINYRQDYGFARRLDDAFEPRFGQIFSLDTR